MVRAFDVLRVLGCSMKYVDRKADCLIGLYILVHEIFVERAIGIVYHDVGHGPLDLEDLLYHVLNSTCQQNHRRCPV
jgi:hypothetical protein